MNTRTQLIAAIVLGQAVGLLGYVDLLFFPLVLAGPLVVGGVAAARGLGLLPVVVLWVSAGLNMTVLDWVLLNEDVVFHLVLTVVMSPRRADATGSRPVGRHRPPSGATGPPRWTGLLARCHDALP